MNKIYEFFDDWCIRWLWGRGFFQYVPGEKKDRYVVYEVPGRSGGKVTVTNHTKVGVNVLIWPDMEDSNDTGR